MRGVLLEEGPWPDSQGQVRGWGGACVSGRCLAHSRGTGGLGEELCFGDSSKAVD